MKELIGELDQMLDRISDPRHGSTANSLVTAIRDGERAGIAAWLVDVS